MPALEPAKDMLERIASLHELAGVQRLATAKEEGKFNCAQKSAGTGRRKRSVSPRIRAMCSASRPAMGSAR